MPLLVDRVRFEMNVNTCFGHPKQLDDLQTKQDIIQSFLEMNEGEQSLQLRVDSDGEDEVVRDEVPKNKPAKIPEVVLGKVHWIVFRGLFQ